MPTGDTISPEPATGRRAAPFEPSAALAVLDLAAPTETEGSPAWDAAWIACLTNSPRWAETARREFARAMAPTTPGPA